MDIFCSVAYLMVEKKKKHYYPFVSLTPVFPFDALRSISMLFSHSDQAESGMAQIKVYSSILAKHGRKMDLLRNYGKLYRMLACLSPIPSWVEHASRFYAMDRTVDW
jgi:hypothetical protein